jgi:hypothetical protein
MAFSIPAGGNCRVLKLDMRPLKQFNLCMDSCETLIAQNLIEHAGPPGGAAAAGARCASTTNPGSILIEPSSIDGTASVARGHL